MPLNWNISAVKDWQTLRDDPHQRAITDALLYLTISAGVAEITEKNALEFFERVNILETLHGVFVHKDNGESFDAYHITPADIRRRIGLHTNAAPMTRARFERNIVDTLNRAARHAAEQEREEEHQRGIDRGELETAGAYTP